MTIIDDNGIEREVVEGPPESLPLRETLVMQLVNDLGWDPEEAEQAVYEALLEAEDDGKDLAAPEMTKSLANWVIGKLAKANRKCADIDALVEEEIAAIRRRGEGLKKPYRRAIDFFTGRYTEQLKQWAASELEGEKKKSIGLIHGTVGFRSTGGGLGIGNEERLITILEAFENLKPCVKITKSVLKTPLKDYMAKQKMERFIADPVLYPGTDNDVLAWIEPKTDKFYIDLDVD